MPNIPDIKPDINIDRDKSIDLLIASVALEELALAHVVNSEAEKIQFVLGTLKKSDDNDDKKDNEKEPTIDELLEINKSVEKMLKKVIIKEIVLEFKLENAIDLIKPSENQEDDDNKDKEDNNGDDNEQ